VTKSKLVAQTGCGQAVYVVSGACRRPWRDFERYLSASEQQRVLTYSRDVDKCRFAVGRVLLRSLLSRELGVPPACVPIEISGTGKPFAVGTRIQASISHSGDFAAGAISCDTSIGIDVECWSSTQLVESLSGMFCSGSELQAVASVPVSRRNVELLRLWTLKEAYAKALGTGIGDIRGHKFRLGDDGTASAASRPPGEAWQFRTIADDGRYMLAVALRGAPGIEVKEISASVIEAEPGSGWLVDRSFGMAAELSC